MKKSLKAQRKKPGPPSRGGRTPLSSYRFLPEFLARLDDRGRIEGISRAEVLRRGGEMYLATKLPISR